MRKLSCFIKVDLRVSSARCLWDLSRTSFGRGSCIYYPYREERGMPNSLARSALRISCSKTSSSKGFARKAKAPASSAVWRTDGSSRPVMKIIRVLGESRRRQACTSRPFMSGIHTSRTATRHSRCSSSERKSAGLLNFSTAKPAEFSSRPSAFSMEASSSSSQMPLRAGALKDEPFASNFSKTL